MKSGAFFIVVTKRRIFLTDIYASVGKRIRRLRKQLGFTQEELADRCGLDFHSIGAVERGERNVSLKSLKAIADALKVTPETLLQEEENAPKEEKKALLHELLYALEGENIENVRFIVQDAKNLLHYVKQKPRKKRKNK